VPLQVTIFVAAVKPHRHVLTSWASTLGAACCSLFVGLRQYVRTSMIRARLAEKNFIISGWQTVPKIFLSAISTCLSFAVYLNSEPESSKTFFSVTVERGK
jgi:hypothetical protein